MDMLRVLLALLALSTIGGSLATSTLKTQVCDLVDNFLGCDPVIVEVRTKPISESFLTFSRSHPLLSLLNPNTTSTLSFSLPSVKRTLKTWPKNSLWLRRSSSLWRRHSIGPPFDSNFIITHLSNGVFRSKTSKERSKASKNLLQKEKKPSSRSE